MKEFKDRFPIGSDDMVQASEARLQQVFDEYPIFRMLYGAMSRLENSDMDEWILAAEMIRDNGADAQFENMQTQDPYFLQKYKYMWSAAIADNQHIPLEERRKLVDIIYQEREED